MSFIKYTYDSEDRLLAQSNGLQFVYDHSGISTVKYNGNTYFYRKDALGNVIALLDINGSVVVKYLYDAWGNHAVVDVNGNVITDETHIGNVNPFRYRSYYYDTETKLYFLKTRFYDSETGRFISQDSVEYLDPETINGLNLYAYCGNNPVMRVDSNGCSWNSFWNSIGNWFSNVGKTIWDGIKSVATTVWDGVTTAATAVGEFFVTYGAAIGAAVLAVGVLVTAVVGFIYTGGLVGAVIFGIGAGFFAGVSSNVALQVSNSGWANLDFGAAMKSGGIGALVGAASGVLSFGLGVIGSFYGGMAGSALSNMTVAGLNVGKAFSYLGGASLFSALGKGVGYMAGSIIGSALANEAIYNLFGYNPSCNENVSEGVNGLIMDAIINFFRIVLRR